MLYERQQPLPPVVNIRQIDAVFGLGIVLASDQNEHEESLDDAGRHVRDQLTRQAPVHRA